MHHSTLSREETLHWLALRLVPGLGSRKAGQLIERFRTPEAVFRASPSELVAAGLNPGVARCVASGCAFEEAASQQDRALEAGVELVALSDPRYPPRLREIFDPPVLLFARGRVELLGSLMLAMVGTRRATPYGNAVAERMASDLARAGLTIVSGMARGIDTASHRGALAAEGDTVAVLGCGVDVVYPSENRKLAEQLSSVGLLLSEFPMGAPAYPQNFPIRNRIISGMSAGVVVVEGAEYSGSAITAKLAMDQGREVFAVPGNITSKMSWGPNLLIRQGAKLVQDWNDVTSELQPEDRRRLVEIARKRMGLGGDAEEAAPEEAQPPLPFGSPLPLGRRLLEYLKVDAPTHIDTLVEHFEDSSPSELIAGLFELEMQGLVRQLPGRNFVKVW
ncbi:MAG: DNA-protecting protein DprA [Bryobacterales bacterium]|nr:DNA-protecting protein DprA [Bryobacterales bacterium]